MVAGLLYLPHACRLSDEVVVARWIENPVHKHFSSKTLFHHRVPIDPSSLTRW
jgi:IS5 family transposase